MNLDGHFKIQKENISVDWFMVVQRGFMVVEDPLQILQRGFGGLMQVWEGCLVAKEAPEHRGQA